MKKSSLLVLLVLSCFNHIFASPVGDTVKVIGNIEGLKDSVIALYIPSADTSQKYLVKVQNGKFEWRGFVAQPEQALISTQEHWMNFYTDTGNVTITIDGKEDAFNDANIQGSKPQDEYKQFVDKYKQNKKAFILEHPSSIVSLTTVEFMITLSDDFSIVDSLYKLLSPAALQNTDAGKRISKGMLILKRSAIGQRFIDFEQPDVNGKMIRLSDFKGKYVLLDFWASWCGPCRAENPNVLNAYNMFKDKNFTVVGVSLDDRLPKWKEAILQDKMPWLQVSDLKGFKNAAVVAYGIHGIPFNFLIDPNGIIIAKGLRDEALINKLSEILNKKG